ncbi:hypothetical protein [Lutimonas zeaxanthinifaciens]|uniref:hypothetical protein n=1 Tax=Lutimonas zeaxanthinifaciens TaxID=3060215 RepID=UPI00265CDB72|nr:hypothetical protein [Lutimonas sp. YSD2104]WKK67538.1 hypothetical protein QZH61_07885 [Lutimonas sp. YSD2104]
MKTRTAYLGSRLLWFFTFIALLMFTINCDSDDDDDFKDKTFLENNDGTKWKILDEGVFVYMRINDDMTKPIEIWMSSMDLDKNRDDSECYYYSTDLIDEETEILENSSNKLKFTYQGEETWTMTIDGNRLKITFVSMNNNEQIVYLDRTNDNVDGFEICPDDMKNLRFKFLKR